MSFAVARLVLWRLRPVAPGCAPTDLCAWGSIGAISGWCSRLIRAARAVVSQAKHKDDRLSRWVTGIAQRRHPNVAAVALANKTARMAWAMLRHETDYDPDFAMR